MTEKLFYADPYLREFDAEVISCEKKDGRYLIVLDRTAFYPEGGGQPADRGSLGEAVISHVSEREGEIFHVSDRALEAGSYVHGSIDWKRRFDHMQQHSGEHIVSGMICSEKNCDNVGFHMSDDTVTIDYNAEISWEELLELEKRANDYIYEGHAFVEMWPGAGELKNLEYRSKKELTGAVRITSFPGADICACCGTHVKNSAEAGPVKFLSVMKHKNGVRIELVCGSRAIKYLSECYEQNKTVSRLLSAKIFGTGEAVERLRDELTRANARIGSLESSEFKRIAEENRNRGDVLLVTDPMSPGSVRRLTEEISLCCGGMAAVFAGEGEDYKYVIIHKGNDISGMVRQINTALSGRGGGRDGFAQGSVKAGKEAIYRFFE